jgi:hypothetical protein
MDRPEGQESQHCQGSQRASRRPNFQQEIMRIGNFFAGLG